MCVCVCVCVPKYVGICVLQKRHPGLPPHLLILLFEAHGDRQQLRQMNGWWKMGGVASRRVDKQGLHSEGGDQVEKGGVSGKRVGVAFTYFKGVHAETQTTG